MRKTIFAVLALAVVLFLAGCASPESGVNAQGKRLEVVIDGNPTTGYQWTCETDESIMKLVSSDYKTDGKPGMAGAGGTYTFVLEGQKGEAARECEIVFTYARSWEEGSACRWRHVTVKVSPEGKVTVKDWNDSIS